MRVLGIDPGLTRCGMGVVEGTVGRPLTLVDVNVLRTSSDLPVPERLVTIEKGIDAWLDEYRPDAVAIERVFARSDVSTVMGTAQASGIAMVCAARRGLPVALHTPSEVKAAVSGNGRADKAQVGAMVTRILRLDAPPKPADAADALALAITHIWRGGAQARIDAALAAAGLDSSTTGRVRDDRLRPRPGRRRHPVQRRPRGRGSRPRADVHPRHAGHPAPGHTATLPTSMVVREDSLTLFGFADEDEKQIFELVQTASGVGPKVAQAITAVLAPDDLRRAIASDDVKTLTRVPGIGQKGAQRIILELKDRIGAPDRRPARGAPAPSESWRDQVHQGLMGLGWTTRDAEKAVDAVAPEAGRAGSSPDVGALLRAALRTLSKA